MPNKSEESYTARKHSTLSYTRLYLGWTHTHTQTHITLIQLYIQRARGGIQTHNPGGVTPVCYPLSQKTITSNVSLLLTIIIYPIIFHLKFMCPESCLGKQEQLKHQYTGRENTPNLSDIQFHLPPGEKHYFLSDYFWFSLESPFALAPFSNVLQSTEGDLFCLSPPAGSTSPPRARRGSRAPSKRLHTHKVTYPELSGIYCHASHVQVYSAQCFPRTTV